MNQSVPTSSILRLQSVDSTNSYLRQRWATFPAFAAVYTQHQTAGRGRRGRNWETTSGLGLAISILLPPLDRVTEISIYPLIVGRVLLGFVHRLGLVEAEMKWPNDVLVSGRKLAGILCESVPDGSVIAGIGINLSQSKYELPTESATSLEIEGIKFENVEVLTKTLVENFQTEWTIDVDNIRGSPTSISSGIGTIGRKVRVVESEIHWWDGFAEGIDDGGRLLVRSEEDQVLRAIVAEDVLHIKQ